MRPLLIDAQLSVENVDVEMSRASMRIPWANHYLPLQYVQAFRIANTSAIAIAVHTNLPSMYPLALNYSSTLKPCDLLHYFLAIHFAYYERIIWKAISTS